MSKKSYRKHKVSLGTKIGGIGSTDPASEVALQQARKFFKFYFAVMHKRMKLREVIKGLTKEQTEWIKKTNPTWLEYQDLRSKFPDIWEQEARRYGLTSSEIVHLKSTMRHESDQLEEKAMSEEENFSRQPN